MFNFQNVEPNYPNIADLGGQRVLGMPGSLTAYINTGNQYDPNYYKQPCVDTYDGQTTQKKTNGLLKAVGVLCAVGAAFGIGAGILKSKGLKFSDLKIVKNIGNFFTNLKNKKGAPAPNAGKKGICQTIGDFFKNLIPKKTQTPPPTP